MNPTVKIRAKVTELEGLRGVLAWWVVIGHILVLSGVGGESLPKPLRILLRDDIPVDVFIILSGFVIFMLLDSGRDTYATFITRRFFRLFPTYICCLGAMIPIGFATVRVLPLLPWHASDGISWIIADNVTTQAHLWQHIFVHLTMLHGLVPKEILPDSTSAILGPAWSISLEWQFYLVAPLILAGIRRSQRFLFGLGLLIIAFDIAAPTFGNIFEEGKFVTYSLPAFLPLKGIYFFWGACSFYAYKHAHKHIGPETLSRILIGLLIAVGALTRSISLMIWCSAFGSYLLRAAGATPLPVRIICGALNSRLMQWLGRISYSSYLCHVPVLYAVLLTMMRIKSNWSSWTFLATLALSSAPLIIIASQLLYSYVEKPWIAAAKTWTANWNQPSASAAQPLELDRNVT